MALMNLVAGVSFARTPLREIGERVARIEALGWSERDRGDPWVVSFAKQVAEQAARTAEAELREVMGEHWVDAEEIRDLLRRAHGDVSA